MNAVLGRQARMANMSLIALAAGILLFALLSLLLVYDIGFSSFIANTSFKLAPENNEETNGNNIRIEEIEKLPLYRI